MTLRGVVAIALVAAAVIAGGCGSSSKTTSTKAATTSAGATTSAAGSTTAFTPGFKALTAQFQQTSKAIGGAIQTAPSKTGAQLATTFSALAARWSSQAGQLSALTPPASVSPEFSTLKAAADRVTADLTGVSRAAGTNNAAAARTDAGNLVRDIVAAKTAATKIDTKLGIT
jgi:hypothetical protein